MADGGTEAVDGVMRGQYTANQGGRGETARRVDERANDAGVEKARILADLAAPRHGDGDTALRRVEHFDAAPAVERRRVVDGSDASQCVSVLVHKGTLRVNGQRNLGLRREDRCQQRDTGSSIGVKQGLVDEASGLGTARSY